MRSLIHQSLTRFLERQLGTTAEQLRNWTTEMLSQQRLKNQGHAVMNTMSHTSSMDLELNLSHLMNERSDNSLGPRFRKNRTLEETKEAGVFSV
jgi:hypothetical protein